MWLHLVSDEFRSPGSVGSGWKKRPPPLDSLGSDGSMGKSSSSSSASSNFRAAQFAFISPVEPLVSLARFSKSMNRVYIPVGHEEEVQVVSHRQAGADSKGLAASGRGRANHAAVALSETRHSVLVATQGLR